MTTPDHAIPFKLFDKWFKRAQAKEPEHPNAFAIATVAKSGAPSVRMVLLKDFDEAGFVFYTNTNSRKGRELKANDRAAMLFHWKSLGRQIRIEGRVVPVSEAEADAYFATRPRGTKIGAWASDQSQVMAGRHELKKRVAQAALKFTRKDIPRPGHWSGYRLVPDYFEFWENRLFRLHERETYTLLKNGGWRKDYLFP